MDGGFSKVIATFDQKDRYSLMPETNTDNPRVMILASGDLWAGAEAVICELCTGLKQYTSVDVTAVLLNEGVLADRCREADIPTHVIEERKYNFIVLTKHTINLAQTLRPHIIHAHRYKENILALVIKVFLKGVHLVSTIHGRFEHQGGLRQKMLKLVNAFILGRAFSSVVAVSHDLKDYLSYDLHIPEFKISCVINGIGTGNKERTNIMAGETITIGSAGRLFPVKDYSFMVDVARDLCRRKDQIRFVLAGDGPDMIQLSGKIKEYGIEEKFQLLGHVNDMIQFYQSIDIYLNTSKHEGMPVTVLEAMSHGIPVVAPDIGGLKELISSGEEGYLVKERTSSAFADALVRLTENLQTARDMGMNARKKIEQEFSSKKMVRDYYTLYSSLI